MSFNSVVLIVASIIFVLLLAVFSYFIYESQKKKYNIIPASCPDYWTLSSKKDAKGNNISCIPPQDRTNWGTCDSKTTPPSYPYNSALTKPCDVFLDKYLWTTDKKNCGGKILWDGVTNNEDYRASCKPAPAT
jgi:hypothetical protein